MGTLSERKISYIRGWLTGVVDMSRYRICEKIAELSEETGSRSELQKLILGELSEKSDLNEAVLSTISANLSNGLIRISKRERE